MLTQASGPGAFSTSEELSEGSLPSSDRPRTAWPRAHSASAHTKKSGPRRGEGKASPACPVQANDPGLCFRPKGWPYPDHLFGLLGWFRVLRACPGPGWTGPLAPGGWIPGLRGSRQAGCSVWCGVRGVRSLPGVSGYVSGQLVWGVPRNPRAWCCTFFVALSSVNHRVGRMECALA